MRKEPSPLAQNLESLVGTDLSMFDDDFIVQSIKKRMDIIEIGGIYDYLNGLSKNPKETSFLKQALQVTYTEFFRNPLTFAHLEQWLLPTLLKAKAKTSELRIWSAGCSTGQEPYSIAMLIEKIKANTKAEIRYRIIATDIEESALKNAERGEYRLEEVRNIRYGDVLDFFEQKNDQYVIAPRIKKSVSFSKYDLMQTNSAFPESSIYGDFDLVICCNLLYYYKPKQQKQMINKLSMAISNHGYLITGETEKQMVAKHAGLRAIVPPSPIFQKE